MSCGCPSNAVALLGAARYSSVAVYSLNALVQFGDILYVSIQDGNTNHQPDVSPSYWNPTSVSTLLNQILNALS